MSLSLRQVMPEDCELIFSWANDPLTRAMSFSSATIPWTDHQRWFAAQLIRPKSCFLIASSANHPVGQIRFVWDEESPRYPNAVVSLSVSPAHRGRGFGSATVRAGLAHLEQHSLVECADAYIRPSNPRSIRLFDSAGFRHRTPVTFRDQPALRLTWRRG